MDDDTRRLKRRHLIFYLDVYDESGEILGHLVDITTKGIKLVSKDPIKTGKEYKLKMQLPEEYFTDQDLHFTGRSLWADKDINPDFFATGFEISGLDNAARVIISKLINELGFND
ncbi:MAG: PilZ domain-containing protein [Proteobacteria bacterium]|nr:PilZ domain-containing protein [Pseudomonadota bacterium]MBU1737556.1 PilZ domain-containing protein [Pseudomonadota bacterium]